jgi:hypothetical protein
MAAPQRPDRRDRWLIMKRQYSSVFSAISWCFFVSEIWKDLPSYWFWICFLTFFLAVYCTTKLFAEDMIQITVSKVQPQRSSSIQDPSWMLLVSAFGWAFFLTVVVGMLPQYWSQLFPLLTIPVLYIVSWLYTNRKSEEKHDDLVSPEPSNHEHGS